ncbi:MAG: ABC transporter ATP-binding protein/permease, partial [Bacteroidota bacterium]|nr:ABC transporter ATP-binding protein/permease [Bacteroidota bacterium]
MTKKIKGFISKLNFRRTVSLTWSVSKPLAITTLLFLVIENMLWLGSVYMLKRLVDVVAKVGHKERLDELMKIVIITGVISVAYACIKSLSGYFSELHATKVNHFIDREIHQHTLMLDYSFYEDPEYLNILKRAREAGADKPYAVVSSLFDIVKNGIMMVSVGYILISIDWMLFPLLAVFVFPILIGRILFSNKGFQLYMQNTGLEREAHYLSSLITGETFAKETRTFLLGSYLITKYRAIKDKLINQQFALSRRRTINELFTTGVGTTAFFSVTAYIVFGTLSGRTTVGDIAVFLVIFPQSYSIMQSLVAAITRLYHNNMYAAHIFELFSLQPKVENRLSSATMVDNKQSGELLVKNVSFKYPSGDEPALRNVTLRVPAGKIVALVGMNGAGKTTLIKLLCKLYEPTEGSIFFGGNDIRHYSASQYRKQISVVFQDFVRYNLTVNENISFGDISREVCKEAVQKAAVS